MNTPCTSYLVFFDPNLFPFLKHICKVKQLLNVIIIIPIRLGGNVDVAFEVSQAAPKFSSPRNALSKAHVQTEKKQ